MNTSNITIDPSIAKLVANKFADVDYKRTIAVSKVSEFEVEVEVAKSEVKRLEEQLATLEDFLLSIGASQVDIMGLKFQNQVNSSFTTSLRSKSVTTINSDLL